MRKEREEIFSYMWVIGAFLFSVFFFVVYGEKYLDSDMASEMVLANLMNKTGDWFGCKEWFYSTEIRIGYLQTVFRVGLWLFPNDWHMARTFSMVILLTVLLFSYLLLIDGMGMRKGSYWIAGVLVLPVGFWYMFLVTFGPSYITHIISILLSLAMVVNTVKVEKLWKKILCLGIGNVIAFVSGLNGVRLIMNIYVPLAVAIMLFFCIHLLAERDECRWEIWKKFKWLSCGVTLSASAVLGYFININVLINEYSYRYYGSRPIAQLDIVVILQKIFDYFTLFGWQSVQYVKQPELFSLRGVVSFVSLLIPVAVFVSVARLVKRWEKLSYYQRFFLLLFLSVLLIDTVIFSTATGDTGYESSYWIPVVPLGYIILHIEMSTEQFRNRWAPKIIKAIFCICVIMSAFVTVRSYVEEPVRATPELRDVAIELEKMGYTQGYAEFWNSNVITEWTDGRVEMWTLFEVNTMQVSEWLQPVSHSTTYPTSKFFVVLKKDQFVPYEEKNGNNLIMKTENYRILGFDSIVSLNEQWVDNAIQEQSVIE